MKKGFLRGAFFCAKIKRIGDKNSGKQTIAGLFPPLYHCFNQYIKANE